eukprot:460147_1
MQKNQLLYSRCFSYMYTNRISESCPETHTFFLCVAAKWVLQKPQIKFWGGVSVEVSFKSLAAGVSGVVGGGLTLATLLPVALPLVIPGVIAIGKQFWNYRKQMKEYKRWEVNDFSVIPLGRINGAHMEIDNMYNEHELESIYDDIFHDGAIIQYDFFTGEIM